MFPPCRNFRVYFLQGCIQLLLEMQTFYICCHLSNWVIDDFPFFILSTYRHYCGLFHTTTIFSLSLAQMTIFFCQFQMLLKLFRLCQEFLTFMEISFVSCMRRIIKKKKLLFWLELEPSQFETIFVFYLFGLHLKQVQIQIKDPGGLWLVSAHKTTK